jgi:DNA-binding SARP family transcriptional activator
MGKRFPNVISRIGESGGSAWQRHYQASIDALNQGEFEHVAEMLRQMQTENLRFDQAYLIGLAYQVCLTCIQLKADLAWHHQAQQEAKQRVHEYQRRLSNILHLAIEHENPQEPYEQELIPGAHPTQMPLNATQTPQRQKLRGFLQRIRALFGSISPSLVKEKAILTAGKEDAQTWESHLSIPKIEEAARPLAESERNKEQGPPSLVIYCLGPFRVFQSDKEITEWHSFKGRDILKYLLVHRGAPVAKDILIDVFWPDVDPKAARRNLHQTIYSLRQALRGEQPEFHHIWFENDCYFLNPHMDIWLDFYEFETCIQAGKRLENAGHIEEAIEKYGTAEGLYQGDFLEENLYEDWPAIQRQQLVNSYLNVVDRLCGFHFQNRLYAAVVSLCQKALSKDKCHEPAYRWLMQCYLALGQRHLAVRQYQNCVQALQEELDIPPSEETVAIYHRTISKGED